MTADKRDFSNYESGDNVHELADGLLSDMADKLEVTLSEAPNPSDLQAMLGKVGTKKELRLNTGTIDYMSRDDTVEFLERSGLQSAIDRDLWDGRKSSVEADVKNAIVMGGVANWTDRMLDVVAGHKTAHLVWTLGGNRQMKRDTEVKNANVAHLYDSFGCYPKEAQYLARIAVPKLLQAGKEVLPSSYSTGDADSMLAEFFEENPHLLDEKLLLARVANSGIIMGLQLRAAARLHKPDFDSDPADPQLFVVTDALPLAKSEEQRKDAAHFQNPDTAIRQVILTGKKIVEAQQAEQLRQASRHE